jgi:hypothetical protein
LADISKINAVLLANIAEIDDVLAANIAKVNGLVFSTAPAFTGLLDTYTGAAAGYSTRRIASSATNLMRIREDSGDTETDIGYDSNGDLDTAAIATHCGSANGYVVTWYDQSGNGNNATQSTTTSQPQIYNGTSVITDNGKPALDFDGSNDGLNCSTNLRTATGASTVIQVRNVPPIGGSQTIQNPFAFYKVQRQLMDGETFTFYNEIAISTNETANEFIKFVNADLSGQVLHFATWDGSTQTGGVDEVVLYEDGAQETGTVSTITTGVTPSGTNCIGYRHDLSSQYCLGTFQEVIVYLTDQSSNRSGIEGNMNAHFQIGNFGTPTSGLLATYTGAAAAYSVRQLANTAALAMRIREDGTDTETDIGFDSNGDLDTAAISSHCGANNGYVVTWYDQSGEQNDATQATTGSQPQIYNGTAVLTVNSKPAVSFDGSNDELRSGVRLSVTAISVTTVQKFDSTGGGQVSVNPSEASGAQLYMPYNNPSGTFRYTYRTSTVTSTATTNQMAADQFMNDQAGTDVVQFFENGTQVGSDISQSSGTSTNDLTLGNFSGGGFNADCHIQEVIVWEAGMEDDRTGIQSNVNTYFSIY